MGLDISHNTWHGAYSSFMRWRQEIARLAGYPPLELMEGFYYEDTPYTKVDDELKKRLPIRWDSLKPNPLSDLLNHSDCDGTLSYGKCGKIAKELEKLLPLMDDDQYREYMKPKTQQFIDGLKLAHSKKETLKFQ